jgi:hypothetical protein
MWKMCLLLTEVKMLTIGSKEPHPNDFYFYFGFFNDVLVSPIIASNGRMISE